MDLLKRWKGIAFTDGGLMLGVILLGLCAFSWSRFVDWSGPADDMAVERREALEGCIAAERALGDGIYRTRPDCRDVLEPARPMAATPLVRDCVPRANAKIGGDDGLDACGYPGLPACLDALPPGCP